MKLIVEGMTCGHCVRTITNAILELDLGARVNIDLATRIVRVEGQVAPHEAIRAIGNAGYQATAAERELASAIADKDSADQTSFMHTTHFIHPQRVK